MDSPIQAPQPMPALTPQETVTPFAPAKKRRGRPRKGQGGIYY